MSAVFEEIVEQERANSFKKGRSEGLEIGLKEGEARGRSEGLQQGLKEGEADGVRKVARNLITSGMPISEIAKNTNLSIDEVNSLRKSMSL